MRAFLTQQFVGIVAQVAAALPLLIVAALLAHTYGLEIAGRFTVAAGLSAFAFALASWGMRTQIVIDRFEQFSPQQYVAARALGIVLAGTATWMVGKELGISDALILTVILFRICDSTLDLKLAFDQVRLADGSALNQFALAHVAKLLTLVALGIATYFAGIRQFDFEAVVFGALVAGGGAIVLFAELKSLPHRSLRFGKVIALYSRAKWFATAQIASAAIVSAPRISLTWLYTGASIGVVGTSLSIAGFFGMAFYTSWLRFLPHFSVTTTKLNAVFSFILETVAVTILLAFFASYILPTFVAVTFGYDNAGQVVLARDVMLASVVFFAGMNFVNLFKISRTPWMEATTYVITCAATAVAAWTLPAMRNTPDVLVCSGLLLFSISIPNVVRVLRNARTRSDGRAPSAIFVRIGSRPVPRVTRMMHVAREVGYECHFLGAMREEGICRQDKWQSWPVSRIGTMFPLLNGTRPLTYVASIIAFNVALIRTLVDRRPALVHASDSETMPAAILYRALFPTRLIFNIHDNISQRYNIPWSISSVLNAIEGLFVLCSDASTVPEQFRKLALPAWCQRKVSVIRNTPIDPGAREPPPVNEQIRIFFGGWLDWGRGLKPLIEMAEKTPRIKLRVAGEGAPSIVREISCNPNVDFLGFLDHDGVMAETRDCHFVSAFYDPVRVINRFAASNKIAEALAVGRPILINSELEIAKELEPLGCTLSVPYSEIAGLGEEIIALADNSSAYRSSCMRARAAYEANYAWEGVRDSILKILGSVPAPADS